MAKRTREEIINDRDKCQKVIRDLQDEKGSALESGAIDVNDFHNITARQNTIQNKINELNAELINTAFDEIEAGDSSPAANLATTIGKLEEAVKELENTKRFFEVSAEVIKGLSALVGILVSLPI